MYVMDNMENTVSNFCEQIVNFYEFIIIYAFSEVIKDRPGVNC